jgi:hypothetical protein
VTSRPLPQCSACLHLAVDPEQTCAAFPDGIPDEIWWNRADHREPFEGDGGIRWTPLDEDAVYPE